jgi:hypothetical protein
MTAVSTKPVWQTLLGRGRSCYDNGPRHRTSYRKLALWSATTVRSTRLYPVSIDSWCRKTQTHGRIRLNGGGFFISPKVGKASSTGQRVPVIVGEVHPHPSRSRIPEQDLVAWLHREIFWRYVLIRDAHAMSLTGPAALRQFHAPHGHCHYDHDRYPERDRHGPSLCKFETLVELNCQANPAGCRVRTAVEVSTMFDRKNI